MPVVSPSPGSLGYSQALCPHPAARGARQQLMHPLSGLAQTSSGWTPAHDGAFYWSSCCLEHPRVSHALASQHLGISCPWAPMSSPHTAHTRQGSKVTCPASSQWQLPAPMPRDPLLPSAQDVTRCRDVLPHCVPACAGDETKGGNAGDADGYPRASSAVSGTAPIQSLLSGIVPFHPGPVAKTLLGPQSCHL